MISTSNLVRVDKTKSNIKNLKLTIQQYDTVYDRNCLKLFNLKIETLVVGSLVIDVVNCDATACN